jgi:hypothetical protein
MANTPQEWLMLADRDLQAAEHLAATPCEIPSLNIEDADMNAALKHVQAVKAFIKNSAPEIFE